MPLTLAVAGPNYMEEGMSPDASATCPSCGTKKIAIGENGCTCPDPVCGLRFLPSAERIVCVEGRHGEIIPVPVAMVALMGRMATFEARVPADRLRELYQIAPSFSERFSLPVLPEGFSLPPAPPKAPRLTVDLAKKTITLDGQPYDVPSENALRWVKVLADHAGDWITGSALECYDPDLAGRPDQWKKHLPKAISDLIESRTGAGSRIRL
jgi:hypothetical protein